MAEVRVSSALFVFMGYGVKVALEELDKEGKVVWREENLSLVYAPGIDVVITISRIFFDNVPTGHNEISIALMVTSAGSDPADLKFQLVYRCREPFTAGSDPAVLAGRKWWCLRGWKVLVVCLFLCGKVIDKNDLTWYK